VAAVATIAYWEENMGDILMRTLTGQKSATNMIVNPALLIDADNVTEYTTPGADLKSPGQVAGGADDLMSDELMDQFFLDPAPMK